MAILIPKVFHQIWLGNNALPAKFQEWADRWLSLNPGWRMEWWTDQHLPEMANRREFDVADKMAAKSDILRYEIIARHGGIYVDSDFEPLRPIEEILDEVNSFYGDERPGMPCNAILGCTAGDPFFSQLVKSLPESFAGPGDIVDKTGPRFLQREIDKFFAGKTKVEWDIGMKRRCRLSAEGMEKRLWGYDWRVLYPYYYTEEHSEWDDFPDAYAKHHWTASCWKNGGV